MRARCFTAYPVEAEYIYFHLIQIRVGMKSFFLIIIILLIKALRSIGMSVVLAGSQTGNKDDYARLKEMCDEGTVIVDDSNPVELSKFILEKEADLLIGGVKERPIAFKLGIGFCDHNHERKIPLAGFVGMYNFALEVYQSVMSPVWQFAPRKGVKI